MEKNKNLSKRTTVILVIIAVFIFALFPRCRLIRDGGSVFYESIGGGMIYTVKMIHSLPSHVDENGYGYYEKGVVIIIFNKVVYSHVYTDYDDLAIAPHTTDISEIKRQIEEIMGGTKNTTQNSK